MTYAVVWIDHKEARIFHVHPEATDETTVLAPQHHLHRHPKGRGEARKHPDEARIDSSVRSREHSTASMPSSSSGRRQRSSNSSSTCTRTSLGSNQRSSASRVRIIRQTERSSPARRATSKRATEWASNPGCAVCQDRDDPNTP